MAIAYDVHKYYASEMQQMPDSFSVGHVFPAEGTVLSRYPICAICGMSITDIRNTVNQRGWKVHPECADGVKE